MLEVVRAKWVVLPNIEIHELHVGVRLFKFYGHTYGRRFSRAELSDSDRREVGEPELELIEALHQIEGIYEVGVDRYDVRITKGEVFDWEPIHEQVERALLTWLIKRGSVQADGSFDFAERRTISLDPVAEESSC